MMRIVTPPFTLNYVDVQDFTGLISVLDNVIIGTGCSTSGNPLLGPSPRNSCLVDVVFVIDESDSIQDGNVVGQPDNYDLINFTTSVVEGLHVDIDGRNIQLGAVRFSDISHVEFRLDDHFETVAIISQIQKFTYTGGFTNITGALKAAQTLILNNNGDCDDSRYPDKIVLITDGYASRVQDILEVEGNITKAQGTTIIDVGVTRNINVRNFERVTSGSGNTFIAADFMTLSSLASDVIQAICFPL